MHGYNIMMQRLDDWFPALSSRPGSSDAKGHSEPGSRDTQEMIVFPIASLATVQRPKQPVCLQLNRLAIARTKQKVLAPREPGQRWPALLVRGRLDSERNQSDSW